MGFSNLLAFVISELYFVFLTCFHFEVLKSLYACHYNSCFSHRSPRRAVKKILYIYTHVFAGSGRELSMHMCVCVRGRKLKLVSNCPFVLGWPQRAATLKS